MYHCETLLRGRSTQSTSLDVFRWLAHQGGCSKLRNMDSSLTYATVSTEQSISTVSRTSTFEACSQSPPLYLLVQNIMMIISEADLLDRMCHHLNILSDETSV